MEENNITVDKAVQTIKGAILRAQQKLKFLMLMWKNYENISFRLQSGRKRYIEKGGKLGRKVGSVKTVEQMKAEYREVISLLRKGYSVRDVAKLSGRGVSTVQRVKRLIKVQSPQ